MMEKSGDFIVSVFDVHKDNLQLIWPCLVCAIGNSSFIALDCELSGLGTRKLINSQAVDDRFKNISEVARTRSIISIGLSCFKILTDQPSSQEKQMKCGVQTFNLMALCSEEYMVEPSALQFLVNHGFDFQKQYSQGIPYHRGHDKEIKGKKAAKQKWDLRDVFSQLVSAKVPIVLHNGLVDLVFLYQNLYADLPAKLSSFISDLEMMFPNGIYDTKYIAEFTLRMSASFLEYVFRSQQLKNITKKNANQGHVVCNHVLPESPFVDSWDCSPRFQDTEDAELCMTYTSHGFCPDGSTCTKSHDVFRAVVLEDQKKNRKRKRKDVSMAANTTGKLLEDTTLASHMLEPSVQQENFKGHRAGHDAFMTGFSFASFVAQELFRGQIEPEQNNLWADVVIEVRNRICLSGKDFPLLIQKSGFSKCSKAHLEKYNRLFPTQSAVLI